MSRIVRATPFEDYTLEIELDNRHKIVYDMRQRLKGVRFSALADIEKFKSVGVEDGYTLVWDSLCQITLGEIICLLAR